MVFHVMGGDRRQQYLAAYIAERGFTVSSSHLGEGTPPQWDADYLILPLPCGKEGRLNAPFSAAPPLLAEIFSRFRGKAIFGGLLPENAPTSAVDYYLAEEITLGNAALTAEGAIALAIEKTPFALAGCPILILGSGRIARILAMRLSALGGRVTVGARRAEALAHFRALGCDARLYEDLPFGRFPLVFNTVPAPILQEEQLRRLPAGALLLELASAPYGFDRSLARELGLEAVLAAGLPGRYAPRSAAALIGDFILKEMEAHG